MERSYYKSISDKSPIGCACHRIIRDEKDEAIDYEFLELNPACARILGLSLKEIAGKRLSEVETKLANLNFPWKNSYAEIVNKGGEIETEIQDSNSKLWYKVILYSANEEHLVTLFRSITESKEREKVFSLLGAFTAELVEYREGELDYQRIAENVRELSRAKFATVNLYGKNSEEYQVRAIAGAKEGIQKALAILGMDINKRKWKNDPKRAAKLGKGTLTRFESVDLVVGSAIPYPLLKTIANTLSLGETVVVKISNQEKMLGELICVMDKSTNLKQEEVLELYAHQLALAIERQKAKAEQLEKTQRFYSLFDNMSSGAAIYAVRNEGKFGRDYIVRDFNKSALEIEGKSKEEVVGKSLAELRPNIDEYGLIDIFRKVWKTGENAFFPAEVYVDDKYYNWYENRVFKLANGEIVAIYDDVTEQKLTEQALRESEEKYRRLYETMAEGVVYQDTTGRIISANQAAERILGLKQKEMFLRHFFNPEWRATFEDGSLVSEKSHPSTIAMKTGKKVGPVVMKIFNPYKKGHKWLSINTIPLFAENSAKTTGVYTTFREITEQIEAGKALQLAKEEAERANATKSLFLSNMSHEIRTPLNGLLGMLQLLRLTKLDEEQSELLDICKTSADGLFKVIGDILDYSKIEAGKMELEIIEFAPHRVVEENIALFRFSAEQKGLSLQGRVSREVPEILQGDPFRIKQVLANLLGNAIKYTEQGRIEISCHIAEERAKEIILEFKVEDTGIGIPEHKLGSIFETYTQAQALNTQKYGGTGLGLSICKALVELMQGDIWVVSKEGAGSSFYFTCLLEKK